MQTKITGLVPLVPAVAFGLGTLLATLAVYNYKTGVHGGAIVSSIGAIVASLLGILAN